MYVLRRLFTVCLLVMLDNYFYIPFFKNKHLELKDHLVIFHLTRNEVKEVGSVFDFTIYSKFIVHFNAMQHFAFNIVNFMSPKLMKRF